MNRRQFLAITALTGIAGTSLLVGCNVSPQPEQKISSKNPFKPNVWVRIDPDSTVTIMLAKSEMGQGVTTALPMLLAEELDADWSKVRVEHAPPDEQFGTQMTGGSNSVSSGYTSLRWIGAEVRGLLIAAAAKIWAVSEKECKTENGTVMHIASGKKLLYGMLADTAAAIGKKDGNVPVLKDPSAFTLIGKSVARLDLPSLVDGSAKFGLDTRLPDMLYAVVERSPVYGGTVKSFDAANAKAVAGVKDVVQIKTGIAVIAENSWSAMQGRQALQIDWDEGANANLDSAQILQQLKAKVQGLINDLPVTKDGELIYEATYELPYLAHITMEPMNCTADVRADHCEVWAPTQVPMEAKWAASQASGLKDDQITVHVTRMGGGFGRRLFIDYVEEAVEISKLVKKPVQLLWTREDDLRYGKYRPASYHHVIATPGEKQPSIQRFFAIQPAGNQIERAGTSSGYDNPVAISGEMLSLDIPTGYWRAVEHTHHFCVLECIMDELAATTKTDPYTFRTGLLTSNTRLKAVADLAAQKAGWGQPLPTGQGRGIALSDYIDARTAVALVLEVTVEANGNIKVNRAVCAVDCGLVVHPDLATAQVEGSIAIGLSAALYEQVTFEKGMAKQSNLQEYKLLTLKDMPKVEVYFVESKEDPGGLGEPVVPAVAPALMNAIFAASGKRVRQLPIYK